MLQKVSLVVIFGPKVWDWADHDEKRDSVILAAGVLLTVLFLIYISFKSIRLTMLTENLSLTLQKWSGMATKMPGASLA